VTARDQSSKGLDGQLAKLVASTNTIKVLTILAERPASPSQIGAALGLSTSAASHHVKKLVGLDMVELVDERDVGGTMQHVYRAIVRPQVGNKEWQKLSLAQRERFSIWIFQLILADAASSFDAALFDACPNNHLSRTPMMLDQRGFDEVAEIQDRALAEIFLTEERSRERIASGEGPGVNVVAAMTCFELPDAGNGPGAAAIDQCGPTATEWREEVRRMKLNEVPSTVPSVAIRKSR
jgi:DNA-binding transcriptional ArsR family regulator